MIAWLKDVATWWMTGWIGLLLYWVPTAFCLVGYTMRCWGDVHHDIKARESEKYYVPSITVGTIIGRAVLSVIPIANFCAGIFDVAPKLFGTFFDWIDRVFSVPLVKERTRISEGPR